MVITTSIITPIFPWVVGPTVAGVVVVPEKPISPILREAINREYTGAELRSLVLQTPEHFAGMTFSAQSLAVVSDDYIEDLYLATRYQRPVSTGILPLRAGNDFLPSMHGLGNYALMSAVFGALFEKQKHTIDPAIIYKAMNTLRISRQIDYVLYQMLQTNPTGQTDDRLIVAELNALTTVGETTEQEKTIYLDSAQLASYTAAGGTEQQAVDYWLANKTQPPAP